MIFPAIFFRRNKYIEAKLPQKVLVINFGLIGDVLMVTPLLEELRRTLSPNAIITIAIQTCSLLAIKNNPYINNIITYNAFWSDPTDNHRHKVKLKNLIESIKFIRDNKLQKYDLIINSWFIDQPLAPFLASFLNYYTMIGFDFTYSSKFYDKAYSFDCEAHFTDNLLNMYYDHIQCLDRSNNLRYTFMTDIEEAQVDFSKFGNYIIISPFSTDSLKEWNLDNWVRLIRNIKAEYPQYTLVLTGMSKSRQQSEQLVRNVGAYLINTVGEFSLEEFALLLKGAKVQIAIDSGAIHIGSAMNLPTFVLFSQVFSYRQVVPYNVLYDLSVVEVDCSGCLYGCKEMKCMKHDYSVVLRKLNGFMNKVTDNI